MRVFVFRLKWQYALVILLLAFFAALPQIREPLITAVTSRGRLVPIYRVDRSDKVVALSFDATWGTDLLTDLGDPTERGAHHLFFGWAVDRQVS